MPPSHPAPPQLKHSICALACKGDLTFAAVRGTIVECRRVHRSGEYRGHDADILQVRFSCQRGGSSGSSAAAACERLAVGHGTLARESDEGRLQEAAANACRHHV